MACDCKNNSASGVSEPYRLKLQSGRIKSYSTSAGVIGAQANHPGSVILPRLSGDTPVTSS